VDHHTLQKFDRDLTTLKERLLRMAVLVEQHIAESMAALYVQDRNSAERLAHADQPVNLLEMQCDDLCVRMILQYQPVASDLRFLVAVLKIVTDLERVGDLAVNIAERAAELALRPKLAPPIDLRAMSEEVQRMLKDALDAFVAKNDERAEEVLGRDDAVDAALREVFGTLVARMKQDPGNVDRAVGLLSIAKSLERIADHATNIAEQAVFLARGKDVRHRSSVEPGA
jgi:phosphate transport system protein